MDLLSCLLGSVQCLETTLRNKSVGETTFRSGLAISEEWNGLLSNVTAQCQCRGQEPTRKTGHNGNICALCLPQIRSVDR